MLSISMIYTIKSHRDQVRFKRQISRFKTSDGIDSVPVADTHNYVSDNVRCLNVRLDDLLSLDTHVTMCIDYCNALLYG